MLRTGLVSLNVHEALTFEGTEICLHPDLFSHSDTASLSTRHSVANSSKDPRIIGLTASEDKSHGLATASSSVTSTPHHRQAHRVIQTGDMIEIRVWDPIPKAELSAGNRSATLRKRPSKANFQLMQQQQQQQPTSAQSSVSESADDQKVRSTTISSRDASLEEATQRSREGGSGTVSSGELTAPAASPRMNHHDDHTPPAKTVDTKGGSILPPVFPRQSPAISTAGVLPLSKPPMARNRVSSSATTTAPYPPPPPPSGDTPGKAKGKARHVRDISDMTIDTVYNAALTDHRTTQLDASHQLADLQVPISSTVMQDEDDDDDDDLVDPWLDITRTHALRLSFIMKVTDKSLSSLKGSARTQVSLLRKLADLYQLSSYDMVTIHCLSKEEELIALDTVAADFLVVTIKDQFISRGDMLFFQQAMVGKWIYRGERLFEPTRGMQAHARELRNGKEQIMSGIVTDTTTITFRSRSARLIWLVQMSSEMWDYASPYEHDQTETSCDIYFDKYVAFLRRLFARWKEIEATHSLTVVFFSRTMIGKIPVVESLVPNPPENTNVYGRRYEDHFRIILENETISDWDSLIVKIKEAFIRYPKEVGWNLTSGDDARRPSSASRGNVLEAVNVTLNLLQNHYFDRDLQRTGNSIVVVSAGSGVFEVDKKLASITYQRMMDNGIGSDMLSLGLPPLHVAPFFLYTNGLETTGPEAIPYEIPHWMHLSFVSYTSTVEEPPDRPTKMTRDAVEGSEVVTDLEIGSNGFLLRRSKPTILLDVKSSSPLLRPKPTPGSKPTLKSTHLAQRQLIAGRDFRDILQACRPRNGGIVPSPLKSLIETGIEKGGISVVHAAVDEREEVVAGRFAEWGSLESEVAKKEAAVRASSQTGFETGDSSEKLNLRFASNPRSPPRVDDLASQASSSSYNSQGSSLLGVPFERSFSGYQMGSSSGLRIQRPPSLESLGAASENDSDISICAPGTDSGVDVHADDRRTPKDPKKIIDELKKAMKDHDTRFTLHSSPQLTSRPVDVLSSSRHGVGTPVVGQGMSTSGSIQSGAPGGIGAALSHHRAGTPVNAADDNDTSSNPVFRVSSTNRLPSSFNRRMEMGSRGLSPMLLPPATLSATDVFEHDERHRAGRNPAEGRSIDLAEVSTPPTATGRKTPSLTLHSEIRVSERIETTNQGGSNSTRRIPVESRLVDPRDIAPLARVTSRSKVGKRLDVRPSDRNQVGRPLSASPASRGTIVMPKRDEKLARPRVGSRGQSASKARPSSSSKRKKAINPFRQQDEDEVLAQKSHKRRRWSHVFPPGEVEFKRHAGPAWQSLTAPAILPLSVGYFPSQEEIEHSFTEGLNHITLSELDNMPLEATFESNEDLLEEMVRQRLTQDYQLVPPSDVNASNFRRASRGRSSSITSESSVTVRRFLSMGHRLQVITYDPAADVIEVVKYDAKVATKNLEFKYRYMCYNRETQEFAPARQTFKKYTDQYKWAKVDRLISSVDPDRQLQEGYRFRRIMFCLVPEDFKDENAETDYVAKFNRLLEYMNKLREKGSPPVNIRVTTTADTSTGTGHDSRPGIDRDSMQRFYVQLRRGKRDRFEWMEVVVDSTFNTSWTYRIMFQWLVASSGKVDAQVQLLQRRCTQYGLNLIPFSQISVSSNVFLIPFTAPTIFTVRDRDEASHLEEALRDIDFVHDGVFETDRKVILECIPQADEFNFDKRRLEKRARQSVHRSGTLIVRYFFDRNGLAIVVVLGNYRCISKEEGLHAIKQRAFSNLLHSLKTLRDRVEKKKDDEEGAVIQPLDEDVHQTNINEEPQSQTTSHNVESRPHPSISDSKQEPLATSLSAEDETKAIRSSGSLEDAEHLDAPSGATDSRTSLHPGDQPIQPLQDGDGVDNLTPGHPNGEDPDVVGDVSSPAKDVTTAVTEHATGVSAPGSSDALVPPETVLADTSPRSDRTMLGEQSANTNIVQGDLTLQVVLESPDTD